jgi:hypothetical protein
MTLAQAQNCTTTPVSGAEAEYPFEFACHRAPNGGTVVATQPDNGLGAMPVSRVAADGTEEWSLRIACTNPFMQLIPADVVALDDGGAVIIGQLNCQAHFQYGFFIRVDATGQPAVAKILGRTMDDAGLAYLWDHVCRTQDGGFVLTGDAEGHMEPARIPLLKLDAAGDPVWGKHCLLNGNSDPYQWGRACQVLEESNGDLVLFGGANQQEWLMRTDGTGTPLMAHQYDVPWTSYSAGSTGDGGYVIGGSTVGNGNIPCIWKLDHDGVHQWSNELAQGTSPWDVNITSIAELPDGSLLATPKNAGLGLMRFTSAGQLAEAWDASQMYEIPKVAGTGNDSVSYVFSSGTGSGTPTVMHATDIASASCALNATTTTENLQGPSWTALSNPMSVEDFTIKTWDLSIGPLTDLTGLDVRSHVATGCPRPGCTDYSYALVRNFGGDASGAVDVTMTLDPSLVLTDFYPAPSSTTGNVVTWNMPALAAFGTYEFYVRSTVPVGTPLGTTLITTLTASQPLPESDLGNNTAVFNDIVSGSYDPNDKLVWPRDFYHIENDSVLTYTIRFQNTGTAEALNVVVQDTLPLDVDTRTFELGATSHPCIYSLTGNGILTFTFENINLPDSNTNEPLSHGLVNFTIRPILPLALGQEITNSADIYFDFNDPIHTPDATVVVTDETAVRPLVKPAHLVVYPVPVKNNLTAVLPEGFKPVQAFAIGVDGRKLPMVLPPNVTGQVQFATQHLPSGAYVLTLRAQDGKRMSARFTKE